MAETVTDFTTKTLATRKFRLTTKANNVRNSTAESTGEAGNTWIPIVVPFLGLLVLLLTALAVYYRKNGTTVLGKYCRKNKLKKPTIDEVVANNELPCQNYAEIRSELFESACENAENIGNLMTDNVLYFQHENSQINTKQENVYTELYINPENLNPNGRTVKNEDYVYYSSIPETIQYSSEMVVNELYTK